jgi:hypothetical protein
VAYTSQRDAITHQLHSAIHVAAAFGIIDAIAVADIEPIPGRTASARGSAPSPLPFFQMKE